MSTTENTACLHERGCKGFHHFLYTECATDFYHIGLWQTVVDKGRRKKKHPKRKRETSRLNLQIGAATKSDYSYCQRNLLV